MIMFADGLGIPNVGSTLLHQSFWSPHHSDTHIELLGGGGEEGGGRGGERGVMLTGSRENTAYIHVHVLLCIMY